MTMCIIIHVIYYMFCKSNNLIQSIIPCTRTFVKKNCYVHQELPYIILIVFTTAFHDLSVSDGYY